MSNYASNGRVGGSGWPGGLVADAQHLRLWSTFVTADEVAQQMREPFEGNSVGQVTQQNERSLVCGRKKQWCTERKERPFLDNLMISFFNVYWSI